MFTILVILHILVSLILILVVLLQHGKGASIGAVFGGSSQTLFGGQGATPFLAKVTRVAAVVFMLTSLSLAVLTAKRGVSSVVLEDKPAATAPAESAAPADQPEAPAKPAP